MRVYLAGPINGCSDDEAKNWREEAARCIPDVLDPMVRDYRGAEDPAFKEIVEGDKEDIALADLILVMYERPSVGTSMEILFAWSLNKPVILIDRSSKPLSPWLRYHVTQIVPSLEKAVEVLSGHAPTPVA